MDDASPQDEPVRILSKCVIALTASVERADHFMIGFRRPISNLIAPFIDQIILPFAPHTT